MKTNTTLLSQPAFTNASKLLRSGLVALGLTLCTATIAGATTITISGAVLDDGDGGTISGTPIYQIGSSQLYVYLVDNSNTVVDKAAVSSTTLSYTLYGNANANYSVAISTSSYNINDQNPVLGLPISWRPTAEGTTSTGDGTPDFLVAINSSNNLTVNFAIDARPTGFSYVLTTLTRDATGRITFPASTFTGSDPEDGTYTPGFSGRNIDLYQATGGQLYYNNSLIPFSSASTATRISNFDVSLLRFQPQPNGVRQFAFSTVDNAGVPEAVPNSIILPGTPLPISVTTFTGNVQGEHNYLTWQTATEISSKDFVIERSDDGVRFQALATIPSKAVGGNSTQEQRYEYTDYEANAAPHAPYLYRIRQTSTSGAFSYSSIVRLANTNTQEPQLSLAPNPTNGTLSIDMATGVKSQEPVLVTVYNAMGTQVLAKSFDLSDGRLSTSIDLSGMPAGNYYVAMRSNQTEPLTKQIVLLPH